MDDNQIIHEAMGLCSHKTTINYFQSGAYVTYEINCRCGMLARGEEISDAQASRVAVFNAEKYEDIPDYTQPENYCRLLKWMRNDERWRIFGNWLMRTHGDSQFRFLMKVEEHQVALIAEVIREGVFK